MKQTPSSRAVSVIIPVYNGAATLQLVLEGLARQSVTNDQFEVVVTDDASTDRTAALLAEYITDAPYRLVILTQPANRGASAARNRAVAAATGEFLVFIDADCVPEEHLLESHLTRLRNLPGGWASIGRIVWSAEFRGGPMAEYYKELYFPDQGQPTTNDQPTSVPFTYFVTSNAAMPRDFFQELGGFDEDFRYLWDDTVLGYRLDRAGGKLALNRQAVVFHHRPLLPGEAMARFRRQGQEAMRLLAKYPELTGLVADPGEVLADRYQQEELYRLLARYALGLGFAEGAARYFAPDELQSLLERPELNTNFETWRDRRLTLYRAELNDLKDDQAKLRAYVRQLEGAYQREQERVSHLQAELDHEIVYSRELEQAQGYTPIGLNPQVIRQRGQRWWRRGQAALRNWQARRQSGR